MVTISKFVMPYDGGVLYRIYYLGDKIDMILTDTEFTDNELESVRAGYGASRSSLSHPRSIWHPETVDTPRARVVD